MSEIQNNRVLDVRLKEPLDMLMHFILQVCKDIVHSKISCARHDGFMTKRAQDKCKTEQETLAKLVERVGHMTAVLVGHGRNALGHEINDTWEYSVDYATTPFQSRSKHDRTVTLNTSGGGTCSCQATSQTGIYCLHIFIAEDQYTNNPPGGTGTLASVSSASTQRPSQVVISSMLQGRLRQYIHPCWHTSTWKFRLKDLTMHAVELQTLETGNLCPPAQCLEPRKKRGRARRKRLPSAGERSSSKVSTTVLSLDVTMPSELSCQDIVAGNTYPSLFMTRRSGNT